MGAVRYACSECGVLPEVESGHGLKACPRCDDELLDLEKSSDVSFIKGLLNQRAITRTLKAYGISVCIALVAMVLLGVFLGDVIIWFGDSIFMCLTLLFFPLVDGVLRRRRPEDVRALDWIVRTETLNLRSRMWTGAPGVLGAVVLAVFAFCPMETMLADMALVPQELRMGRGGVTLITYALAHGDWVHVGFNALGLFAFGVGVDLRLGRMVTLLLVIATAVCAGLGEVMWSGAPEVPIVGISGAVYGLMGASLALMPRLKQVVTLMVMPMVMPQWVLLPILVALYTFFGVALGANVAHIAHLTGFASGVVLGFLLRLLPEPPVFEVYKQKQSEAMAEFERM